MVNIAVFAAFRSYAGACFRRDATFKPVCGPYELDVSCYEWQKRQETARKWQRNGKVDGKNGKDGRDPGHVLVPLEATTPAVVTDCGRGIRRDMKLFKVLATPGDAVMIELKYHK
jgi:hypothetical protein